MPAVVMMHGRAGPYSSLAKGFHDATTLSKRHKFWGELMAANGYVALPVDGGFMGGLATGQVDISKMMGGAKQQA